MSVKTTKLLLVRHAPVKSLIPGKITGQRDVGIDLSDKQALKNCAQQLAGHEKSVWITSTLSRTQKTAFALAKERGFKVKPLAYKELMEQNFGLWQSKTWDELGEDETAAAFWQDPAHITPPQGESFEALFKRTKKGIHHLLKSYETENIVVVCHAGTIRACLAIALELPLEKALSFKIDTFSLTEITHFKEEGKLDNWSVNCVNRIS